MTSRCVVKRKRKVGPPAPISPAVAKPASAAPCFRNRRRLACLESPFPLRSLEFIPPHGTKIFIPRRGEGEWFLPAPR